MNVIEFPLSRLEKQRAARNMARAGFKKTATKVFDLGFAFDKNFEATDKGIFFNPNDIAQDVFFKFIKRFPCFQAEENNCPVEILDHFLSDRLTDGQDRAVEAILEVTSSYTFGFSIIDAFEIWDENDRNVYLQILSEYSKVL